MALTSIISRELLVRARQPATHRVRWLAVGLGLLVLLPTWVAVFPSPALMGRQLFTWLSALVLACCLVEGVRQTAPCLSEERRQGTLPLLFLTELKALDIVLGKLIAASLGSFYSLLAILPVLGLPLLTGGVSGAEFARVTLVLMAALLLAQAIGLSVSSRSLDDLRSLFTAFGAVLAVSVLPPLVELLAQHGRLTPATARLSLISPGMTLHLAFDRSYRVAPAAFWISLGVILLGGLLALIVAARLLRRGVTLETGSDWGPSGAGRPPERPSRKTLLEADPVRWLVGRYAAVPWWVWLLVAAMATVPLGHWLFMRLFPATPVPVLGWGLRRLLQQAGFFVPRLLVAFVACRLVALERRSGALELLLCTPLGREEILRGQRRACWQALLWPLVAVSLLQHGLPVAADLLFRAGWTPAPLGSYLLSVAGGWAIGCACLLADSWALIWFGAWAALQARTLAGAVGRTFVLVVLLPSLLMEILLLLLTLAGLPGSSGSRGLSGSKIAAWASWPFALPFLRAGLFAAKDLFFVRYARRKLRGGFRGDTLVA